MSVEKIITSVDKETGAKTPAAITETSPVAVSYRNSIKILVAGKTSCGKTTLINGLIGMKLPDSHPGELSEWCGELGNVSVTVWDTPGLLDGTDALNQEGYLRQMKEKCSVRDLAMYCIKITETRFVHTAENAEVVSMKKVTQTFGNEFWKDCVIVLTYANVLPHIYELNDLPPKEKNSQFQKKIQEWQEQVQEILIQDIQVPNETVQSIKIVPAGHYRYPHLPGMEYWFSNLWHECAGAICSPDVRQAMIKINQSRMKIVACEVKADSGFKRPIQYQPIVQRAPKQAYSAYSFVRVLRVEWLAGGIIGGFFGQTIAGLWVAGHVPRTVTVSIGALIGIAVGSSTCRRLATSIPEKMAQCWKDLIQRFRATLAVGGIARGLVIVLVSMAMYVVLVYGETALIKVTEMFSQALVLPEYYWVDNPLLDPPGLQPAGHRLH